VADDPTPKPDDKPPPTPSEPDHKAEAEKWKELSRKNEAAAKKATEELKALKDAGDASKSETEKLAARQATLEAKLAEADARALRAEVASEKQLPGKLAKRLQGSTREELEADADELLESMKPLKDGDDEGKSHSNNRGPRTTPRERLTGGGDPSKEPEELDPRKLAAKIPRR
jgi:hypothetical protein